MRAHSLSCSRFALRSWDALSLIGVGSRERGEDMMKTSTVVAGELCDVFSVEQKAGVVTGQK